VRVVRSQHASSRDSYSRCADERHADPRRALGRLGEDLAAAHLQRLGFTILARNVRTPRGEIDLIAFDGEVLVFAEVKARRADGGVRAIRCEQEPLLGLRTRQRARVRRAAAAWLDDTRKQRPVARTLRFDALGVIVDARERLLRLDHIEGAW
jgi:putative endonuclease